MDKKPEGREVEAQYLRKAKAGFGPAVLHTCEGDLILTINALIDYAGICEHKAAEMEQGFESASLQYYAERFRRIAGKWSAEIGFDRDKAIAICERKKKRPKADDDYGEDALMLSVKLAAEEKGAKTNETD